MTHGLTCAWIMPMPWNTPKQEKNGATLQKLAEGARMETWTFHDISIPLTLMFISRKSCEPIWASKCSVSTSGSIDRRTRWIDMVTKAVGDVMCLNSSATTTWMARFSRTDAATLSTKGPDACCLIQLLSWSLSWISAVSYGICKYLCICRIPCETISAAKMEWAPASDGQAFEKSRLCSLYVACPCLSHARLNWSESEVSKTQRCNVCRSLLIHFWNTSTMKDKVHMHYPVWPQDPNTTFLTSWCTYLGHIF